MKIPGRIGAGRGLAAARLARLEGLAEALGYEPAAGTLNVRLARPPDLGAPAVQLEGHRFYEVAVGGSGIRGHLVRYPGDQRQASVEIVAPVHLRGALRLQERGTVEVEIMPAEEVTCGK